MNSSKSESRRRKKIQLNTEALESRQLLTAGAGDTFAIMPGTVASAGKIASVKFTIDSSNFTLPKGQARIGIDIAVPTGSTLSPDIVSVKAAARGSVPASISHAVYVPNLQRTNTSTGPLTSAVITKVGVSSLSSSHSATYTVNVKGKGGTTGNFLLGFYLPGDADGDGKVTAADVTLVKSEMGAKASSSNSKYTFDADANRDGKITPADLRLTKENLGAITNISPVVSANLNTGNTSGSQSRVTTTQNVTFTGAATPGASVKYVETAGLAAPVATTADSSGNYTLIIPLGVGANTFNVTTMDSFGQSISGTIAPVTYINSTQAAAAGMTSFSALTQAPSTTSTTSTS